MRETLDPHFGDILQGLQGKLPPSLFEECVQDLLLAAYPALVPIYGGQDAGMDAAVADGQGEAFPVVITTEQNVIGNFTRSLKSYRAAGGERDKVVLACSVALTPNRRRNLEARARQLGFSLIQVHEQRDLAARLYRDSGWTKKLLGLSGAPRSLSAIPQSRQLLVDIPLRGREEDLKWLLEAKFRSVH